MSECCVDDCLVRQNEVLISKIAKLEAHVRELDKLVYRDCLVDLPNRRSFLLQLERLIDCMASDGRSAAMLFVDVNGLKSINDTFGHRVGDQALIEVAQMLVASVRNTDFVARMHGDEFAILLDQSDESEAWQMAVRIFETVGASQLSIGGKFLSLGVAVGVGAIKRGDDPQSVIERADRQMYRVKTTFQSINASASGAFFKMEAAA